MCIRDRPHQAAAEQPAQAESPAGTTPESQTSTDEATPQPTRRRVRRIVRRVGSRAIQQDSAAAKTELSDEGSKKQEPSKNSEAKKAEPKKKEQKAQQPTPEPQTATEEDITADQLHPGEREEADIVDEPVRLKGSTRLESKRRWREENLSLIHI